MPVPLIADRGGHHEPTAIEQRIFKIEDYAKIFDQVRPSRMYTGEAFRVAVFRLAPGQAQEPHMHSTTTHAWFVVSGIGEVAMDDDRLQTVTAGYFCVHSPMQAHGLRNAGSEDLIYVVLSIEREAISEKQA